MEKLSDALVVVILQLVSVSNQYLVHLTYTILYVDYISVKNRCATK